MKNDDLKEKSRSLIKFISIDLLLNVLLQLVLQTFLQRYFDNYLIPILIGIVVLAVVVAVSWGIYISVIKQRVIKGKEKKMIQSSRDKIQALQTEVLQDFFEIQMTSSFSNWKEEVQSIVVARQNSSYSTYKEMKDTFDEKGLDAVTVKDFDVTALSALMRYDFRTECCLNNQTRRIISHIVIDRNGFSHISNYKDIQNIISIEETALANINDFLCHLQSATWNYPQKDQFFRKYLGTGNHDGMIEEVSQSVASEYNKETEIKSYIRHYLQNLQIVMEEREVKYVGLSYNLDGHNDEKKMLEELVESNLVTSSVGLRIVAEGGYGKSWTLSELAGRFAKAYLDCHVEENDNPIPVLIELGKLYNDCNSIRKKIAQLLFLGDENLVDDFYRNNRIILLLDAMDEAKAELQEDLSREIISIRDTLPNTTLVCSSRKSCIEKIPIDIPCYAIKELDDAQICDFMVRSIPKELQNREVVVEKAKSDWIGEKRKEFLRNNRTPFYLSCYVNLICETGDNDFVDTTQLIEKFLNAVIDREIRKTGFNSDKTTFINFLRELCRLMDSGDENGNRMLSVPENEAVKRITDLIIIEEGKASVKAICRKLVEIQLLSRDEDDMLLSFAHQNYKEYINRKYPEKKYKVNW